MQWLAFRYRLAGELYYETAMAYGHDPWANQWDFSGNGDGTLFYPGTPAKIGGATHVPVASIRLKMIREGMEDFEYLTLLSRAGGEAEARQIADALFPTAYATEVPAATLMAARERLAARIVALTATGGVPEPAPVEPGEPAPLPDDPAPAPTDTAAEAAAGQLPVQGGCAGGPAGLASALSLVAAAMVRARRRR
jgi:hypothetical protein